MLKNTNRFYFIILFFTALTYANGRDPHSPNTADTSVIASIGNCEITAKEFRESYEFGPSFVKKFKDPKMAHLQYMINEKLIALEGYTNGIDNTNSVKRILKEIEDDIIVTEWYRQKIVPVISVDSSLIKRGIDQSSVGLTFRYIFTDNEFDIKDIKILLDNGHSFDSLYSLLNQDFKFYLDEVPTNFFTLFEDNPKVADELAHLKPGAYSDIINTKDGFYLVQLDQAKKDFIITPAEYLTMWRKVEKYYSKKMLDSITTSYIKEVMEECPPTISGEALKKIFELLSKVNYTHFTDTKEEIEKVHFNPELNLDESFDSEILVNSKCDKFTIKDFVEWYSYRDFKIDFSNPTASTLKFVKDVLFKMVRDKRLIGIARSQGYADDPDVQIEVQEWRDKLAYWKQKSIAIKHPAFTDYDVQRFYTENKIKYEVNLKDTPITYEIIKDKVKNDLMQYEYNKQLHNYLNSLEEKYPIKINEKLLNSIQLSDENLSKKADLFILKKGGTLPRQAFPTIDNEWRYY
ncbi:MAG: hypothetical protein ACM34M_09265 [Ignavibacteria bacterium]